MRLRPRKGEGERSKSLITKGPLLIATALFVGYPVCIAQAVTTSSALGLPIQQQQQTGIPTLLQTQPRNYLSLRSLASLPSNQDLNSLESTLKSYKTQLETLKSSKPLNPTVSDQIASKIAILDSKINNLESKIIRLKNDLAALQLAKNTLTSAIETLNSATTAESSALSNYTSAQATHTQDVATVNQATQDLEAATSTLQQKKQAAATSYETLNQKKDLLKDAAAKLDSSSSELQTKQQEVDAARSNYDQAVSYYNNTLDAYNLAYSNYLSAQSDYYVAQNTLNQAEAALNQAQGNYDNNLIPDPNWTPLTHEVAYTRLVPVTTTITTGKVTAKSYNRQGYNNAPPLPTSNEQPIATTTVDNISFQWGGGYVLNSGRAEDVLVEFTGVITVPTTGYYQFYAPGDDGVQLYINGTRYINDWYDKGGGGSVSQQIYLEAGTSNTFTLYFYENGGGANVWLYYYTPATGYQIVPASWLGQQTTTETTYVEETYYVTEVIPGQTHPLIHDPALLPPLQETQANYQAAQATYATASTNWTIAQQNQQEAAQNATAGYYQVIDKATVLNTVSAELDVKSGKYIQAQTSYNESEQEVSLAQSDLESKQAAEASAQQSYEQSLSSLSSATSNEASSKAAEDAAAAAYQDAQNNKSIASSEKSSAEASVLEAESTATSSNKEALQADTGISFTEIEELLTKEPDPEPQPEPEGSPEIPAVIEDLMEVDLEAVDPTELTPEQAQQLVEAALVVFETAPEGSPEYQQALDALYLAAQEDDIVLSEDIANIPGVGAAAQAVVAVFNIVGNVGADISPKARKKAQTLVVTTLVVGQIAQTAALATAASGSTFRRRS